MLDGTTNAKDARLVAAIEAADPFDGGCPADVEQAPTETPEASYINRAHKSGRERGLFQSAIWLRQNGFNDAASALVRAVDDVLVD